MRAPNVWLGRARAIVTRSEPAEKPKGGRDVMIETLDVAKNDRFQILSEHADENLTMEPSYRGTNGSAHRVIIQDTLNSVRTRSIRADGEASQRTLHRHPTLRPQDGFINLADVALMGLD
jgi:4-oxalocrotonate tautomerase